MRKLCLLFLALLSVITLVGCEENVVKLYIWGEYHDESVIAQFTEETGIKVKIILFDSNEVAVTQIENSSFDVCVPSDYAIEQLASMNLLQELDWERIFPNQSYEEVYTQPILDVFDYLKNSGFEISKYAAPYFCGVVNLLYNTETVDYDDLEEYDWDILSLDKYKVSIIDSSRDAFMLALKTLGYSMNTENLSELEDAYNYLRDTKHKNTSYKTDQILEEMNGVIIHDIAVIYSGDGLYLMSENPTLDMYSPTKGTDVWIDGMVIPKNARNVDGAYELISWLSSFDSMLANSEYVGYTSPRQDVLDEITSEEGTYGDFKDYYSIFFRDNDEIYKYLPTGKRIMDDYWNQIRAYEPYKDYSFVFVFLGAIVLLAASFIFIYKYKLRRNALDDSRS
jgi:spermidine/putrescine-binding protein